MIYGSAVTNTTACLSSAIESVATTQVIFRQAITGGGRQRCLASSIQGG